MDGASRNGNVVDLNNNRGALEAPQNGLAGLKHWRHDLRAACVVFFISITFALGIADASGAPAMAGIISAIICGVVLFFVGGSYVTVGGPAAGLAPLLLASMVALGGDPETGYRLLLGAIFIVGVIQYVMSSFKMGDFASIIPTTVIHGMLFSIGCLIIVKEIPLFYGVKFHSHEFWATLGEIPQRWSEIDGKIFALGLGSLVLLFFLFWSNKKAKFKVFTVIPIQVVPVFIGFVIVAFVGGFEPHQLVQISQNPIHGIVFPDFIGLFSSSAMIWTLIKVVIMITLVDAVESLATMKAIDSIDKFKRTSDPNRVLKSMSLANILSSLFGGLTNIPGGIKSTANVNAGGRTQWVSLYISLMLLAAILIGRPVINLLPMAAIGAVIMFTGFKLCLEVWEKVKPMGYDQVFVFLITILTTLSTDLLVGIIVGSVTEILVVTLLAIKVDRDCHGQRFPIWHVGPLWRIVLDVLRSPFTVEMVADRVFHVHVSGPVLPLHMYQLEKVLERFVGADEVHWYYCRNGRHVIASTPSKRLVEFGKSHTGMVVVHGAAFKKLGNHRHSAQVLTLTAVD